MSDPTDAEIDADLCCYGFDPTERYPEYSHDQLREAYRAGFDTGSICSAAAARADARSDLADELSKRGQQLLVGLIDELIKGGSREQGDIQK